MAEDKRKRKKKKRSRRDRSSDAPDEEQPAALPIEQGEAEFANMSESNMDDTEPLVADDEQPAITLVQVDDEDAIPAPIAEFDAAVNAEPEFTEDGLAVAMAVDMSGEDEYIYSAIEYDPDSKPPLHKNRRFRVYTCLALSVVIAVVTVVVIYVTKSAKGADIQNQEQLWDGDPSASPTMPPSSNREASGIREQVEAGILQRGVNFTDMDKSDPRYLALEWILHADELQLDSDDKNLYQRYVLALMAFSLDSLAWFACGEHRRMGNVTENFKESDCMIENSATRQVEEHKVWLSSTEECEWYGVICSKDEVVRGVELIGNDLIGEIPPEVSELRFLQYLALNGNCLYGTIPPEIGQMPSLLSLELHGNGLSGELPPELADASKLQMLNLAMQFQFSKQCYPSNGRSVIDTLYEKGGTLAAETGELNYNTGLYGQVLGPNVNKWASMKGLHLFDNSFNGIISDEIGDLKYLVFLRAHNNVFISHMPDGLSRLKKLRELYLHQNRLYYDIIPDIGLMDDLEDFRVNENEMDGKIPSSLYNLKKLKKLWLHDTLKCEENGMACSADKEFGFTGSIMTEIGNLKKLSQIFISNNPLTGTVPTEIGLCEDLAIVRMHKTNIKGSAPIELCKLRDIKLNNDVGTGIFYADCRPNNKTEDPFFECDCCSDCCDHTTEVCIADD